MFAYITGTLKGFLREHGADSEKMYLGFTFSFPCAQKALDKSLLVRWTKGVDIQDAVNADVCEALQTAMDQAVRQT